MHTDLELKEQPVNTGSQYQHLFPPFGKTSDTMNVSQKQAPNINILFAG